MVFSFPVLSLSFPTSGFSASEDQKLCASYSISDRPLSLSIETFPPRDPQLFH